MVLDSDITNIKAMLQAMAIGECARGGEKRPEIGAVIDMVQTVPQAVAIGVCARGGGEQAHQWCCPW